MQVGSGNKKLKVGDKVVVPFTIACGKCFFCEKDLYSLCDNTNPNVEPARQQMGQSPSGLFGLSEECMDIYEYLKKDHQKVSDLFKLLKKRKHLK